MSTTRLTEQLGYRFKDEGLLRTALTHRSFGSPNNERLEFLGDGLLNCTIAADLYHRFPKLPEGDLSRLRANLVRQDSLHQLALILDLGSLLQLGEGELKGGGRQRPSLLADALEAVFGAIYLDGGFIAVQTVILRLYTEMLDGLRPDKPIKDAKTRLQEWLQGRKKALPKYQLLETTGAAHEQHFRVLCEAEALQLKSEGVGTSRRLAEQDAAQHLLKLIES